ncbi:MAG TPA: hypothetical protein VIC60_01470 [Thermomicrobiales bacterium]|jgi:hypothetical protein
MTDVIARFIVVVTAATLLGHGQHINDTKDAAQAPMPLAGWFAQVHYHVDLHL